MALVEFRRDWRNHRKGSVAEIGSGIAIELERRGFVSRVEASSVESVPANKAAVGICDLPNKSPARAKPKRARAKR